MDFLKNNWFKLAILLLILIGLGIYGISEIGPKYRGDTVETSTGSFVEETQEPEEFDWEPVDAALPIFKDTLNTYKSSVISFRETVAKEEAIQDKAYNTLSGLTDPVDKQWVLQLITYSKDYTDSSHTLIVWLDSVIRDYERMIEAIDSRDETQYLINSNKINESELEKEQLLDDFVNKEQLKQDFAATGI